MSAILPCSAGFMLVGAAFIYFAVHVGKHAAGPGDLGGIQALLPLAAGLVFIVASACLTLIGGLLWLIA